MAKDFLPHRVTMDADKLRELIQQREPENIKLDFKQKLHEINHPDKEIRARHWNELIKDVLALANGNIGTAQQTGYLVIGVADKLNQHGTRDLYDVGDITLSENEILTNVNRVCLPKLHDIFCKTIFLDGKRILIVEIPPSPHLHETIRALTMSNGKTTYPENTVFIRRKADIGQASTSERQAILAEKQGIAPPKPIPPKLPTPTKRTPTPPSKPATRVSPGWLVLLSVLICAGLLTFGIVMNLILSATPPRKTPTQATGPTAPIQAASIQETATPESTSPPTQQPTNTHPPKPIDTATATPTNTAVVPPTNTPTAIVLPTNTPLPPPPAAPVEGTGDVMTVDNWEIRVERIEFAETMSFDDKIRKSAGRFALLFLAVTNRDLSPETFTAFGTVEIQDAEGRRYEEDSVISFWAYVQYDTDIGAEINPDATEHVVAAYDISKQRAPYTLIPGSLADSNNGVILLPIP